MEIDTTISLFSGVYFIALVIRFVKTCSILNLSAFTYEKSVFSSKIILNPFSFASIVNLFTKFLINLLILKISKFGFITPDSSLDISSIFVTRMLIFFDSSIIVSRYSRALSPETIPSLRPSAYPSIIPIGVFNSWLTESTKSFLIISRFLSFSISSSSFLFFSFKSWRAPSKLLDKKFKVLARFPISSSLSILHFSLKFIWDIFLATLLIFISGLDIRLVYTVESNIDINMKPINM